MYEAHNEIGPYGREKQYGNFIEKILKARDLKYKRELIIGDTGNVIDFLIDDKIVLELKCKRIITEEDYNQIKRYLWIMDKELGIIVNFRMNRLDPRRVMNPKNKLPK